MRPGTIPTFAAGIMTGALITTTIMFAAPARADVAESDVLYYAGVVCTSLTDHPSIAGILTIGKALTGQGYTAEQAGELIASAVINVCPQHLPLLTQFINVFSGRSA